MVLRFVMFLVLGLIVGIIARWRLPRKDPSGWFAPLGFGVAGSLLGGSIASALYHDGGPIIFIIAVLGAITVLIIYQAIARRRVDA